MLSYAFRVVEDGIPEATGLIERFLAPFAAARSDVAPVYVLGRSQEPSGPCGVWLDGALLRQARDPYAAFDWLLWHVSGRAIESVTDRLVVHAGAVSRAGEAVVFPAPMESGKTTLAAGLTIAGFDYLTDEAALIDPQTLRLYPFPRPLRMDRSSVELLPGLSERLSQVPGDSGRGRVHVRAEDLRPRAAGGPCAIRYVVVPLYEHGSSTSMRPMTRAEAIAELARNAINKRQLGPAVLPLLRDVVAAADCYRLRVGDLESAVRAVRSLFAGV